MNVTLQQGYLKFDPSNLAPTIAYYTIALTRNGVTVATVTKANRDVITAFQASAAYHYGYTVVLKDASDATVDTITKGA